MSGTTVIRCRAAWIDDRLREDVAIVIEDGRVADIAGGDAKATGTEELLDWSRLTVLPGAIDTHSHHREPGFSHKETIGAATRAAALGGVTITIGMPNVDPPITSVEHYRDVLRTYDGHAYVDFNLNPAPTVLDEIEGLASAGCLGFKVYMVVDSKRAYPHMPGLGIENDGTLLEIGEAVEPTGRPLMVHPHNQSLMDLAEKRTWDQGRRGPEDYVRAQRLYDGLIWDTANETLLSLQLAIGFRLHILHLISVRSIDMIRRAKGEGRAVTGEVNPFAIFLGDLDLIQERGPYVCGRWSPPHVKDALYAALSDGTIDVVGSDHAPHTREDKELGWTDMFKSPSGTPQLQEYFSRGLTEVHNGRMTLGDWVRVTSRRPAEVFGLYPERGHVGVGASADLIGVDLEHRWIMSDEEAASGCGWSAYHGDEFVGRVVHTMVRGSMVVEDGNVVGKPGFGRMAAPADVDS